MAEILEALTLEQWHYVRSEDNPADDCTRGVFPGVKRDCRWLSGPSLLRLASYTAVPSQVSTAGFKNGAVFNVGQVSAEPIKPTSRHIFACSGW